MKTFYHLYYDNAVDYHIFGFIKMPYHFNGKSGEQDIPVWHCVFIDDEEYVARFWKDLYNGYVDPIRDDYQSDTTDVKELLSERVEYDLLLGTTEHGKWGLYGIDSEIWPVYEG